MLGPERWALALLAAGGFVFTPGALNRFVFAKLALAAAAVLLAALAPARGRLPRRAVQLLAGAALVLVLAALLGPDPAAQLLGRAPRYEGLAALPVYLGCCIAGARLLGPSRARGSTAWFLRALAIAALVVGVEAVFEAAGARPLSSDVARPGGLLGNASDLGAWAVLALGPLSAAALRTREPLLLAGALAAASALVVSGSRGALVGAFGVVCVLLLLMPRQRYAPALLTGLALIAVGVFALPSTRARVEGASPLAARTAEGRLLLWGESMRLLAGRPVLGVGPSGYVDRIPRLHSARYERRIGPADAPDSPHDWLLQAAAAGGPVLLAIALLLAAMTLQLGRRAAAEQATGGEAAAVQGILAGLAGYAIALLGHFTSPGTTPLAACYAGVLLARPALTGVHRPLLRRAAASAFAMAVLVLGAAALAEIPLRTALAQVASGRLQSAEHDFKLSEALRPWDRSIAADAAHAYAVLARLGIRPVLGPGEYWDRRALAAFPESEGALSDGAVLAAEDGDSARAAVLINRAERLDPRNPALPALARSLATRR